MTIILRQTKGAPLTHAELDGNFGDLDGRLAGKAVASHTHALADLTSHDAGGAAITNYLIGQDSIAGAYAFVQTDSGREKIFAGASPETWTVPALAAGTQVVVHNLGSAALAFAADGVTLKGFTTLEPDKTCALSWLPGDVVKIVGESS